MKTFAQTTVSIYGIIAGCFFCYFMVTGEIKAKTKCIDESGYVTGILWGCDEIVWGPYGDRMGGRWWGYAYNSITWPFIFFEE